MGRSCFPQDEEHRITITGSASKETKEALKATGYNSGEFITIE